MISILLALSTLTLLALSGQSEAKPINHGGSCFDVGFYSSGTELLNQDETNFFGVTGSAEGCQLLCQKNADCGEFNWDRNYGNCYLDSGKGDIQEATDWTTGPRICTSAQSHSWPNGTWNSGEECSTPCSGPRCEPVADMMRFLVDFSVDPCDDFFAFSCSTTTRGTEAPISPEEVVYLEDLVNDPPKGYEYLQKFYKSCTEVDISTEEVFTKCFDNGKCDDIFGQFIHYLSLFTNTTMLPAVTPNWEEVAKDLFGGQGWNWWDFAASTLKHSFFLEAFQKIEKDNEDDTYDIFQSDIFFTPMLDTVIESCNLDYFPTIHIVPMSIPENRKKEDKVYLKKYKTLMKRFFISIGGDPAIVDVDVEKILDMEKQIGEINPHIWFQTDYDDMIDSPVPGACDTSNEDEDEDDTSASGDSKNDVDEVEDKNNISASGDSENDANEVEDEISDRGTFSDEITIEMLYELVPSVEWKVYIEQAFGHNTKFKIQRGHPFSIPSVDLITKMGNWTEAQSTRDQANLLTWRMFIEFAKVFMQTGSNQGDILDNLFNDNLFNDTALTRSDKCISQIETFFPKAYHDMFIANYLNETTKIKIRYLFENLKKGFEQVIEENDWMSKTTKRHATEKLTAMEMDIGELSPNTTEFKELKEKMSPHDYMSNILAISNYKWNTLSNNINKEKELPTSDTTVFNAQYDPTYNKFEVYTGLIIHDFVREALSLGLPRALLYGGFVTATLGHEMGHGFDDERRYIDKDGFRLNWWQPSEYETYSKKTQCMIDQYANFTITYRGRQYQIPEKSYPPGDNIADNIGAKVGYRSYMNLPAEEKKCMPNLPFKADQMFWLGYAFEYCRLDDGLPLYEDILSSPPDESGHYPAPWRVNTVLANQPEFAAAFKCPTGSPMNPGSQGRCSIF